MYKHKRKSNQIKSTAAQKDTKFLLPMHCQKKNTSNQKNKNSSNRLENNESITHTRSHLSGSRRIIFIFGSGAFIRGTAGLRGEG
jgi:predicted amidophosphoribosyltransferase